MSRSARPGAGSDDPSDKRAGKQAVRQAGSQTIFATSVDNTGLAGLAGIAGAPRDDVTGPPGLCAWCFSFRGTGSGAGNIKP